MPSSLTSFHSFTLGYSPYPPVSVYGTDARLNSQLKLFLPVYSGKLEIGLPRILALPSRPGCPDAYAVGRPIHKAALPSFQGPFSGDNAQAAGLECSPAIHRLRLWGLALGSASPCADCHGAGILGFTVSKVFTLICAYSFRHPHFSSLHGSFPRPLHS
jgi:hypothetical protein